MLKLGKYSYLFSTLLNFYYSISHQNIRQGLEPRVQKACGRGGVYRGEHLPPDAGRPEPGAEGALLPDPQGAARKQLEILLQVSVADLRKLFFLFFFMLNLFFFSSCSSYFFFMLKLFFLHAQAIFFLHDQAVFSFFSSC